MPNKTTFWKLLSENKIEIPHYQRDYVQGWKENVKEKATNRFEENKIKDIRERFVYKLYSSIKVERPINLNLIFGSENGSNQFFVPVDGQQRLTTLFLVHWYIALRSKNLKSKKTIFNNFRYQTRKTSSDFFELLCCFDNYNCIDVSKEIQDQNRFFSNHQTDPTVLSALVMITEIEKVFVDIDFEKAFEYLISNHCSLNFDEINLGTYHQSDELYIKMNGRGKPLTYFENFKAWLPDYIKEESFNIGFNKNWKLLLDTKWLDLFWKYKDDNDYIVDQEYMRFFNGITQLLMASEKNKIIDDELKQNIKLFINSVENQNKNIELEITLEQYENLKCFNESSITEMFEVLDILSINDEQLSDCLKGVTFFTSGEKKLRNTLFVDFISGTITYADRLRFYAMYKYLLANRENFNEMNFNRWMRVLRNLIENTSLTEEIFIKLVRKIDEFASVSKNQDFLFFIQNNQNIDLAPFQNFQLKEEYRKANLIIDNPDWEKEIIVAESHSYFKGQIYFLLEMSENNLSKFIEYRDKAIRIFTEKGLIDNDKYIIHRALLAKGDYLFELSSSRWGFCKNNEEWREKIFRDKSFDHKRPTGRIGLLKDLFDDISIENIETDLHKIIADYSNSDWRYEFIKHSTALAVCGEKLINWQSKDEIYLISRAQMNSTHWELRSWCFYKKQIEPNKTIYKPFTNAWYFASSKSEHLPCGVIDNFNYENESYAIDIHFSKEGHYVISLHIREAKGDDETLLRDLNTSASLQMEWGTNNRLFCCCKTEQETVEHLNMICNKLMKMIGEEKMNLKEVLA